MHSFFSNKNFFMLSFLGEGTGVGLGNRDPILGNRGLIILDPSLIALAERFIGLS